MTPDEVEEHMYAWGVVVAYNRWVYHGEEFDQENNGQGNTNIEEEGITMDAMQEILDDVRAEQFTNDWRGSSATGHGPDMPNDLQGEGNKFARLMRDAEKELYPGCEKFSVLSFIMMLLHIKLFSKWSNNSLICYSNYQEDEPYGFGNSIEVDDQPILMNRDDTDSVYVDVLNDEIGVDEEEDDSDAFINDDDDIIDV
ncbi:hypothetical protein RHSIM_Rhsim02G0136100 [Rhododendron simsii]|uniref:Transposase n=1 Tax=Rhododendron simsii TaxID=118357 RepID=A0A834H8L6_RHOSS|nr:hypothetical protein RHSIM_Rhsim02G0136100 [Rhododendron simsii]